MQAFATLAESRSGQDTLLVGSLPDQSALYGVIHQLEALGLQHVIDQKASALPHGTRRLVELARAIALRPSFVLLDEPAAGLSPVELEMVADACQNLARSGVGVLLIEHNVPMVLSIADTVTCLHQGRRLFQGTPAELRADTSVASVFLGIDEPLEASS